VRLATYNVHDCIGRDGRFDPARVADVLAGITADLIALQEVTVDQAGNLARLFENATGMRAIDGSLFARGVGRYGNLLLTGVSVIESRLHDLSCPACEPRGAIDLLLETGNGPLRVVATHLGLRRKERRSQIRRLARLLSGEPAAAILLGDFNVWSRFPSLRPLTDIGFSGRPVASFPTWPLPAAALDRILARAPVRMVSCWRKVTPMTSIASDHFPVLAEVEIASERGSGQPVEPRHLLADR
jgi:endonuclease/exonuclease/phosphatase family metal-dependent hydrolase